MDPAGSWTTRTLRCACRYQQKFLCPCHAAFRRLKRASVHPAFNNSQEFPLVPNESGNVMTKHRIIGCLRSLLDAAAIPITRVDERNNRLFRFGGHAFRVSGAQLLGAGGVPVTLIQLLGRWSSQTIQKYVQQSHLAVVPSVPEQLLCQRSQHFMQDDGHIPISTTSQSSQPGPSTTPSRRFPNKIPEAWTAQFSDQQKTLEELSKQVAALTLSLAFPDQSLVVRRKSTVVSQSTWRLLVVDTDHVKCRKCFNNNIQ